jgi:hypothetical protein
VATGGFDGDGEDVGVVEVGPTWPGKAALEGTIDGDGFGVSLAFGTVALGVVATGAAPLPVGDGSKVFCLGRVVEGVVPGLMFAGMAAGVPGLVAGLIEALGGGGNLPCWISEARCATLVGNVGPRVPVRGPPAAAIAAGVGAGLLMTVLMTVVLWMLLKMMLFGGAAT